MSDRIAPIQFRNIDPFTQKQFNFYSDDPRIRLTRATNRLLKDIGNDIIIRGLDILNIKYTNNLLEIELCKGVVIQDITLIEILDDFTIEFITDGYDLDIGYILIHTDYKYTKTIEDNPFKIYINYLPSDYNITTWDFDKNRIYVALLQYDETASKFNIINPYNLYINSRKYSYRGFDNYNLRDIYKQWSNHIDFLGFWETRDFVYYFYDYYEKERDIFANTYYEYPLKNNYLNTFNKVFIYNEQDNIWIEDLTNIELIKNNKHHRIYNKQSTNLLRTNILTNNSKDFQIFQNVIINSGDEINYEYTNQHIAITIYSLDLDPDSQFYNLYVDISHLISISKTDTHFYIKNTLLSSINCLIVVNTFENNQLHTFSGDTYNFELLGNYMSFWIDLYYEDSGRYYKNQDQFKISKNKTHLIIDKLDSFENISFVYNYNTPYDYNCEELDIHPYCDFAKYVLPPSYNKVELLPTINAFIYRTTLEANEQMSVYIPPTMDEVFNSWDIFVLDEYYTPFNRPTIPPGSTWSYDSILESVFQSSNSGRSTGFISQEQIEHYIHEVTLQSTNNDDDSIGLVIAFSRNNDLNDYLILTVNNGGNPPSNGFGLIYSPGWSHDDGFPGHSRTWLIASSGFDMVYKNGAPNNYRGWNDSGPKRVKVTRQGDLITIMATKWNDLNNYDPASTLTLDLNSDARLTKFKGPSSYGYWTYSQANSFYQNIIFRGGHERDVIIDAQLQRIYRYNFDLSRWDRLYLTLQQYFGYERIVINPDTTHQFLIRENDVVIL